MLHLEKKAAIKNNNELEFAIFCIENLAARLKLPAENVYDALAQKSDILDSFIIPLYEILHTQDKNYIIDELLEVMDERGVRV